MLANNEKLSLGEEENPDDILKLKIDLDDEEEIDHHKISQKIVKAKLGRCMCRHN